jgi:hypothetical protein
VKTDWLRAKGEEDLTSYWTKNKKGERWVGLLVFLQGVVLWLREERWRRLLWLARRERTKKEQGGRKPRAVGGNDSFW